MGGLRLLAWSGLALLASVALVRNLPHLAPGMLDWAEPGNVAAALAGGRGFSDPFAGGTGPTAWVSPLPVWAEAAVFLALGIKTTASAKALLVLAVLSLGAANALLLSALAPHGRALAGAASAAFLAYCALVPGSPLEVLSEAPLDVLLSALLLWSALAVDAGRAGGAGACLVASALLAPLDNAGLALSAGIVALALAWRRRGTARGLLLPAAALAAAFLSVACWTGRNAAALGRFIPLKSNFWFELNLANVDSADGLPRMETVLRRLPFFSVAEFERYARLGEPAYVESFRAPASAALRAHPGHFAANVLRRAGDALVFCKREGGGAFTSAHLGPADAARLASAGELIPVGASGFFWTRIDSPPAYEFGLFRRLGLADMPEAWADWSAKRLAYDAQYRGLLGNATGFLTAGLPVAALLMAALLGGGRLPAPAAWAAAIALGMLLPFILVNHNDRHQLPLIAMQSVAIGACAQAVILRRARAAP
jgi:hypothetical protein